MSVNASVADTRSRFRFPSGLERKVLPIVTPLGFLLLWEAAVRIYKPPLSLLPPPSIVAERLVEAFPILLGHALSTTIESVLGFVLATVFGAALGTALIYSRLLMSATYPSIIFFQLIPKIALAPLFVVWLGIGMEARVVFAVFIAFFPVVIATMAGLKCTPPEMMRLCRGLTATPSQIFFSVCLPYALPVLFSGMKIAVTFAIIGVVIGEFISAQRGLGYIIIFASSQADTALVLAAISMLCAIGLGLYGAVVLAERLALRRWGPA